MRTLPQRRSTLMVVALSVLASLALLTAVPVFADEPSGPQVMAIGVAFLFMFVIADRRLHLLCDGTPDHR